MSVTGLYGGGGGIVGFGYITICGQENKNDVGRTNDVDH